MIIKPCPFCGSDDNEIVNTGLEHTDFQSYAIYCTDCVSYGSSCNTECEAIESWNKREIREKNEIRFLEIMNTDKNGFLISIDIIRGIVFGFHEGKYRIYINCDNDLHAEECFDEYQDAAKKRYEEIKNILGAM